MSDESIDLGGRPSTYTIELADIICSRLAEGESMRSIGRDELMPAMSTLFKWLREHEEFTEQYVRAREISADVFFEDVIEISDDLTIKAEHKRIMVDSRKWVAGKLQPKKYGDQHHINVVNKTPPSPEERKSGLRKLLGKCQKI